MNFEINLPRNVSYIIDELNDNGYPTYVVGGCVRDSIIGITPNDWDICTAAKPEDVMRVFSSRKIILTGLRHGTVTVVVDDEQFEVTTFRIDGKYSDNRRPEEVYFTKNIIDDLSRRDFTINAMAYNTKSGLIDPFGGQHDIEKKIVRCVGNADDRFNEDALRILRCIRFSIKYKYSIDGYTATSIMKNLSLLNHISKERIISELVKTLPYGCSYMLARAIQEIVPELNSERFAQCTVVEAFNTKTSLTAKLAFFFDFDESILINVFERLKSSNKARRAICATRRAAEGAMRLLNSKTQIEIVAKYILSVAEPYAEDVVMFIKLKAIEDDDKDLRKLILAVQYCLRKHDNKPYKIAHLEVNGNDIQAIGYKGEQIGYMLNQLLEMVIHKQIENRRSDLMEYLMDRVNKH